MRAGTALTQAVEFSSGHPDGDISWELLDGRGQTVTNGTVTPAADAISAIIAVDGASNGLAAGLMFEPRELQWSYTTGGLTQSGRYRYRLEAFLPFGVSEDGVRRKLGIETHELEDATIDLVRAYGWFRDQVSQAKLDLATDFTALAACDGIEARAALVLLPLLQVKVAQKESSGTDQFERPDADWALIQAQLEQFVAIGIKTVNPLVDPTTPFRSLMTLATRDDPVTGAAA